MRNYAARHSIPPGGGIPPGIRFGLHFGLSPVHASQTSSSFHPSLVTPNNELLQAKNALLAQVRRLNEMIASLLAEAEGDEYLLREVELIRVHLRHLAEAL